MTKKALIALPLFLIISAACAPAPASALPSDTAQPTATQTPAPTATPEPSPTASAVPSPTPQRDTPLGYSTTDRPDDHEGFQIHFVYAIPSDGADRFMDINGDIELSVNAANSWLAEQTGGSQLRFDTHNGRLDITFLRLPYTADQMNDLRGWIVDGLDQTMRDLNFDTSHKLYMVYYDGLFVLPADTLACGIATSPPSSWGLTATIFLRGYSPQYDALSCPALSRTADYADWLELVMLHEIFHLLGAVPGCAPNEEDSHAADSGADLMSEFYNTVGPQFVVLDRGHNDYYQHETLGCPDLADSVFLEPLPEFAEEPPSWRFSSRPRSFNPFEALGELQRDK